MSEITAAARRFSDRKRKGSASLNESPSNKKTRGCFKAGCLLTAPTCCLQSSDSCCMSGHTSRWYHMSLGEHYCNYCFDNYYRAGKTGHQHYSTWSNHWGSVSRASKPSLKAFVANELLPYWIKCFDCGKWRSVQKNGNLGSEFIGNFTCPSKSCNAVDCETPEDENVIRAKEPTWIMQLVEEPLLKKSPAGPYLKRFLSEDVGLCPTDCTEIVFKEIKNIEPFYLGQCGESPIWVKPDEMDDEEIDFAKNALIYRPTYLGLRNLIVTIWNMAPEWLTINKIQKYIICRGLVRIYLVIIAEKVINLLTKKAVINYGIVECPLDFKIQTERNERIVVIGAGLSGLAAAKHLSTLGYNVTVLEAKTKALGRAYQEYVGPDAIFIQGLTNNPFTIMAYQAKKHIKELENSFIVFRDTGEQLPFAITERVDHELYGLIHGAIEYATLYNKDSNWYDTIMKNYKEISKMSLSFCHPEAFHLFFNQFEIEQRADLKNLSLLSWEFITPLMGNDGMIPEGFNALTGRLTENLAIKYDSEVKSIDYSSDEICITTKDSEKINASHVLITVPVSFLRSNNIKFTPPLPESKTKAFDEVGDYFCEKLIMEFPKRFWIRKIKDPFGKFSVVSPEEIFFLFVDVTFEKKNSVPTLMTYIQQKAFEKMKDLTDEMIVAKCMVLLTNVFECDGTVPEPTKWLLTHWSEDKYGGSYGTYLKVNGTQSCFDELAKTIDDKIYFAGEATFRNMPSTISGAYLSGLREAYKIIKQIESV